MRLIAVAIVSYKLNWQKSNEKWLENVVVIITTEWVLRIVNRCTFFMFSKFVQRLLWSAFYSREAFIVNCICSSSTGDISPYDIETAIEDHKNKVFTLNLSHYKFYELIVQIFR